MIDKTALIPSPFISSYTSISSYPDFQLSSIHRHRFRASIPPRNTPLNTMDGRRNDHGILVQAQKYITRSRNANPRSRNVKAFITKCQIFDRGPIFGSRAQH